MATYLETHKQRVSQMNRTRRNRARPSGVVVIHTYECPWRRGVAAAARYFLTRTNHGSYHALVDWEQVLQIAPWSAETFHDTGTNNHSVGISGACYAAEWLTIPQPQRDMFVRNMALAAARYAQWLQAEHGITIPARRITRAQSRKKVPGFLGHGESDPGRRSDPGKDFDWALFLAEYSRLMALGAPRESVVGGYDLATVQTAAQSLGGDLGPAGVDGVDGPATRHAIETAQLTLGVPADGVWGPITQEAWMNFTEILTRIDNRVARIEATLGADKPVDDTEVAKIKRAVGRIDEWRETAQTTTPGEDDLR